MEQDLQLLVQSLDASFTLTTDVSIGGLSLHKGDVLQKEIELGGKEITIEVVGDLSEILERGMKTLKLTFKCKTSGSIDWDSLTGGSTTLKSVIL